MTLEVGRRWVNGKWTTDIENEGGPGGSGVTEITSDDSSVTITNPTGPVVDLSASGGALPETWTVVVEDDPQQGRGTLRYEVETQGILQLQCGEDADTGVVLSVVDAGVGGVSTDVQIDATGDGVAKLSAFNNDDPDGAAAVLDGRGSLSMFTVADLRAIEAWDAPGNVLRFGLLPTEGQMVIGVTSDPPDNDLSASQLAFWFDATDGAAKLMLKGKTADGTVVVGEVALSP